MKLLFVVLIAILGCALAQEEPEPAYLEFGTLADGDVVVDIYYSETTATAELTEHTLNINWEAQDISFVRVSVYYEYTSAVYSGLPADVGSITVTNAQANQLGVFAYLYGPDPLSKAKA